MNYVSHRMSVREACYEQGEGGTPIGDGMNRHHRDDSEGASISDLRHS